MKATQLLHDLGQSLWLDNITRDLLDNGTLQRYIDALSVTGLTSNPIVFDNAIKHSTAYDMTIRQKLKEGKLREELFFELALEDLTRAADLCRPIYDRTDGVDGWVSLEVSPLLAYDTASTLAAAKDLFARAGRPNLFIKIPGTSEGLPAIEEAIFAVALRLGTATPEAILRRFNSYNVTHPTYKALAVVGKAVKTIYLCECLSSFDLRYEVNEGLNVVERWNAAKDFLCYGRQGMFATNSREQQETTTLCLQLLQNCLMLINTLLVERSLTPQQLLEQFMEADRHALTPLFYEHVNPYGLFALHLDQPSFMEAA